MKKESFLGIYFNKLGIMCLYVHKISGSA